MTHLERVALPWAGLYDVVMRHSASLAVTLSALIDGGQPWRRGYGDNLVYTDWARDNFITGVRDLVRRTGGGQAGVGVECDHISLDLYRSQCQSAPK